LKEEALKQVPKNMTGGLQSAWQASAKDKERKGNEISSSIFNVELNKINKFSGHSHVDVHIHWSSVVISSA
jgi:hypothetical protein